MEEWLRSTGATISPKIAVQELPGRGRGIICREKIRQGETLIKLRRQQLVNYETIGHRGDEEERRLRQRCPGPVFLAYYIYKHHQDESNYWYQFMKSLPTEQELQDTMPLVWLDPAHRAVLPHSVLKKVLRQHDQFTKDLSLLKSQVDGVIDDEKFKWAWMCVNTRCIYMDIPGTTNKRRDKVTLAPYADYLNHTCGGQDDVPSVGLKIDGKGLLITAGTEYNPGDEVFLSYGPHDNATLLTEYGFVVDKNPWDSIDISATIVARFRQSHFTVLQTLGYYGDQFTVNACDGASFRTQMALAALLEPSLDNDTTEQVPTKLASLADGANEATVLYPGYKELLTEVTNKQVSQLDRCKTRCSESTPSTVPVLLDNYMHILLKKN